MNNRIPRFTVVVPKGRTEADFADIIAELKAESMPKTDGGQLIMPMGGKEVTFNRGGNEYTATVMSLMGEVFIAIV